jgi:hypothetical protein
MPFAFFCFQYACDSGKAKLKDSRNNIVNKGSGKRSSSGHNTRVPNHPETSSLYTLWVLLCLGNKKKKPLCGFFDFFFCPFVLCMLCTLLLKILFIFTRTQGDLTHLEASVTQ